MDNSAQYARGLKVYDTRAGITKFVTSHPKFFGLFFLLGLISAGFFAYKYLTAPKILASVNGIPIYEKYVKTKKNIACLSSFSDSQDQALNKIIDFYILKEGARQLGIVVTTEELRNFVKGNQSTRTKLCPEEYEVMLLIPKIKGTIMPSKKIELLIAPMSEKKLLEQVIHAYKPKAKITLRALANTFVASPSGTILGTTYRFVTPDMDRQGIMKDELLFNESFKLHEGEISKILSPKIGSQANQLIIMRVVEETNSTISTSFSQWFTDTKKKTNIQITK